MIRVELPSTKRKFHLTYWHEYFYYTLYSWIIYQLIQCSTVRSMNEKVSYTPTGGPLHCWHRRREQKKKLQFLGCQLAELFLDPWGRGFYQALLCDKFHFWVKYFANDIESISISSERINLKSACSERKLFSDFLKIKKASVCKTSLGKIRGIRKINNTIDLIRSKCDSIICKPGFLILCKLNLIFVLNPGVFYRCNDFFKSTDSFTPLSSYSYKFV